MARARAADACVVRRRRRGAAARRVDQALGSPWKKSVRRAGLFR